MTETEWRQAEHEAEAQEASAPSPQAGSTIWAQIRPAPEGGWAWNVDSYRDEDGEPDLGQAAEYGHAPTEAEAKAQAEAAIPTIQERMTP